MHTYQALFLFDGLLNEQLSITNAWLIFKATQLHLGPQIPTVKYKFKVKIVKLYRCTYTMCLIGVKYVISISEIPTDHEKFSPSFRILHCCIENHSLE